MARGIDFDVEAIINYDHPFELKVFHAPHKYFRDMNNIHYCLNQDSQSLQTYVHRVGRTARAGAKGQAYSLVDENQVK